MLREQTKEQQDYYLTMEEEIRILKELLQQKEDTIKKKDAKIEQLRKKLESFGVFE